MKSKRTLAALAATAVFAAMPVAVLGADLSDYVINVPVKISALGPGHRAEVQCSTLRDDAGKGPGRMVSRQSTQVPLDGGGNYAGTISVKVAAGAAIPNRYECFLVLDGGSVQLPSKSSVIRSSGNL